jgi:BirA family biotin operon repressor/biotin-[acetyl-CoA-carboxylase] ligase
MNRLRAIKRLRDEEQKVRACAEERGIPLGTVCCFERVDSTMNEAFRLHAGGAENHTVVLAHEQNRGRGRFGRRWVSVEGGLYASFLLTEFDPSIPYAMIAAYAVYLMLRGLDLPVTLKWVNDVLCGGDRKIAGVLVEEKRGCTVIGVGVNLNMRRFPPELGEGATSLALEQGRTLDPVQGLCLLMGELRPLLHEAHRGKIEALMEAWEVSSLLRGRKVRLVDEYGETRGVVKGIERKTGALLLQQGDQVRTIYEGRLIYED